MGMSPDTHLFYGYVWHSETPISQLLHPYDYENDEDNEEEGDDDWVETLLLRRGWQNPWDDYPPDELLMVMARTATNEQWAEAINMGHVYDTSNGNRDLANDYTNKQVGSYLHQQDPEFKRRHAEWDAAKSAIKSEFHCDISSYGAHSHDATTAYIYVTSDENEKRSYRSSWDDPTVVDPAMLAALDTDQMDIWLEDFINALMLPMGKPDWGDPPVGPGWFMVSSYG